MLWRNDLHRGFFMRANQLFCVSRHTKGSAKEAKGDLEHVRKNKRIKRVQPLQDGWQRGCGMHYCKHT